MRLIAAEALPGRRYLTQKGITIQMVVSERTSRFSKLPLLKESPDGGGFLAFTVSNPNLPSEIVSRIAVAIPKGYTLEDPTIPEPVEDPEEEKVPVKSRLFGIYGYSTIPTTLLSTAKGWGFYVRRTASYFIVGNRGRNVFAVFFSGQVGFPKAFQKNEEFNRLPVNHRKVSFMPYRISLVDSIQQGNPGDLVKLVDYACKRSKYEKDLRAI